MSCKCGINELVESINVYDIVNTIDSTPDLEKNSSFSPGNSYDEKKLCIKIHSETFFGRGTKLKLKLISFKDNNRIVTKVKPISVYKKVEQTTNCITFDFISADIPLPFGLLYLPTIISDCVLGPQLQLGNAVEYRFVLYMKCHKHKEKIYIPLIGRYIGCDVKTDFKHEKVELVSEPDEDHNIKVICGTETFFCRKIHAVSHSQAPKPLVFYYTNP